MGRVCAAMVITALALGVLTGGLQADEQGTLREKTQKLQQLKGQIEKERRKAKETAATEAAVQATLKKIDRQLRHKGKNLKVLGTRLRSEQQAIRKLSKKITQAERELKKTKARWAGRVRALYKQGQFGYFRLLFSAESLTDMARRMKYLGVITAQDQILSERYSSELAAFTQKKKALQSRRAALARDRNRLRATRAEVADEKWRQRILLARLQEEKQGYLTAIRELEAVSTRLQQLINQLSKQQKTASPPLVGPFAARKGKLPWPTDGEVAFRFGRQKNRKLKTVTFNKGIGIRAPLGRQIQAVYDGTVLYADWFRGYGRLIILDHGQGFYSLYAHGSEFLVQVGDGVRAGQVIGRVGETGSLEGPQLYFELRHRGNPQDPLVWLSPRH